MLKNSSKLESSFLASTQLTNTKISKTNLQHVFKKVAWPSGLRRWFKAPVSSGAWVRIPPLPISFFIVDTK